MQNASFSRSALSALQAAQTRAPGLRGHLRLHRNDSAGHRQRNPIAPLKQCTSSALPQTSSHRPSPTSEETAPWIPPTPEGTFQALEKYGTDLTAIARAGKLDPVIGRDSEIRRVVQVLSRRTKNNPVLIGEPGRR